MNGESNGSRTLRGALLVAQLVRDLGFPILVAGFLLWRLDGTLRDVAVGMNEMRSTLAMIATALGSHGTLPQRSSP